MADIVRRLADYEVSPRIVDPWANEEDAKREYGITLTKLDEIDNADCVIVAVAHNQFRDLTLNRIKNLFKKDITDDQKVLIDVKGLYAISELKSIRYAILETIKVSVF